MTGTAPKTYRLTAQQIANDLNVSRRTIYNWLELESPPPHIRVGGVLRFNLDEVVDWARKPHE